jgi:hypothetical protein
MGSPPSPPPGGGGGGVGVSLRDTPLYSTHTHVVKLFYTIFFVIFFEKKR